MRGMTTAERRGYQLISDDDGAMMIIACDQRGGMRDVLAATPEGKAAISDGTLGLTKIDIARHLARHATAVLIDPLCAVPKIVDEGHLHRSTALVVGLDASGWDTSPEGARLSRLVPGVTSRDVRRMGAAAGKIMVYLRSDMPSANTHNLALLKQVIDDFAREDLLLVTEFLSYALPDEDKAVYQEKIPDLAVGGVKLCLDLGANLLKIPYPGTAAACAAVTALCGDVPWAVLSAGVDHATFIGQVETAMAGGASGVIAGRSLWKDCISLDRIVTKQRLETVALPRLRELQRVIARHMPRA